MLQTGAIGWFSSEHTFPGRASSRDWAQCAGSLHAVGTRSEVSQKYEGTVPVKFGGCYKTAGRKSTSALVGITTQSVDRFGCETKCAAVRRVWLGSEASMTLAVQRTRTDGRSRDLESHDNLLVGTGICLAFGDRDRRTPAIGNTGLSVNRPSLMFGLSVERFSWSWHTSQKRRKRRLTGSGQPGIDSNIDTETLHAGGGGQSSMTAARMGLIVWVVFRHKQRV